LTRIATFALVKTVLLKILPRRSEAGLGLGLR
jgi:hypothetical protein